MCIAQAADIFGTGLVAGAFVMGAFAVHPAAASLDPAPHVLLRQELIRRLSRFLPPFMLLPVPSSLCALGLCRTSVSRPLDALGCALSLATVAITVAVTRHSTDALRRGLEAHCLVIGKTMSVAGMWRILFE